MSVSVVPQPEGQDPPQGKAVATVTTVLGHPHWRVKLKYSSQAGTMQVEQIASVAVMVGQSSLMLVVVTSSEVNRCIDWRYPPDWLTLRMRDESSVSTCQPLLMSVRMESDLPDEDGKYERELHFEDWLFGLGYGLSCWSLGKRMARLENDHILIGGSRGFLCKDLSLAVFMAWSSHTAVKNFKQYYVDIDKNEYV